MNYKNIPNVDYARYDEDGQDGPSVEGLARIDEMYLDGCRLYVGVEAPDGSFHSIHIPVLRGKGWGDFVRSLVGSLR